MMIKIIDKGAEIKKKKTCYSPWIYFPSQDHDLIAGITPY